MVARRPLWAALSFALLLGAGYGWVDLPPDSHASGQSAIAWVQAQRGALAVQGWLVMLAWLPGAAFLALVHRRMQGAPAAAFLLGSALLMALLSFGVLLRLGLARHAAELAPDTACLLLDLEAYWGSLATIGVVLQATSVAIATRHGALPAWLFPFSALLATEQLMETLTMLGDGGFLAPGGTLAQLGAALFGIWVIATGAAASSKSHEGLAPRGQSALPTPTVTRAPS